MQLPKKLAPQHFLAVIALFITFSFFQQNWFDTWFAGLTVATVALSALVARRTTALIGIGFGYWILRTLYVVAYPENSVQAYLGTGFTYKDALVIRKETAVGLATFLLMSLPFLLAPGRFLKSARTALGYAAIPLALYLLSFLVGSKSSSNYVYGMFGDRSSTACLVAICGIYGLQAFRSKPLFMLPYLLGLSALFVAANTSMAFGGWTVGILTLIAMAMLKTPGKHRWFFGLFGAVFLVLLWVAAYYVSPDNLFSSSSRWEIWAMGMEWWANKADPLFGAGPYTWTLYGPTLQMQNKVLPHVMFVWMHNDPLQVLFEGGAVALFLALAVAVEGAYRSFRKGDALTLAALLSYVSMELGQFLLHRPFSAAIGLVILASAIQREED